jgi:hypothetical protein
MSDRQDEKLDAMLRSRRVVAATPDLAQRIILKARQTPQNQPSSALQWLRELFAEFHLPKPAYVLAGTLLLGIVVGLNAPTETAVDDSAAVSVQEFLYADQAVVL